MGKIIAGAGMSVSLDGFVNDANGSVGKLNPDYSELIHTTSFREMIRNTGAVIMGRRTYEMADPFMWANDDYEFQTPIFVLTHTPPEKYPEGNDKLGFTFVTDGIEDAITRAKAVVGDRNVQVIGASTVQQCLNSGLCDELQINTISVVLGDGLRLICNIDSEKIRFERVSVEEVTSARTSVVFKIVKTDP